MKSAEQVRQAFNYLSEDELITLRNIVMMDLPADPVIVNIGAGAGTSGLLFLETRRDSIVYTIDITDESSPFGCLEGERIVVNEAGLGHLMGTRWFQIHGDSKGVAKTWPMHKGIDLLFIDGDHTYEGCMGDLVAWYPFVHSGMVIAVHDYKKVERWQRENPREELTDEIIEKVIKPYPGVDEAVDDFLDTLQLDSNKFLVDSLLIFQKPY